MSKLEFLLNEDLAEEMAEWEIGLYDNSEAEGLIEIPQTLNDNESEIYMQNTVNYLASRWCAIRYADEQLRKSYLRMNLEKGAC